MCETIGSDPFARPALPADIAAALPALVDMARQELAPAPDGELMGKLVEICAGLGMGLSQKEKTEWQAWACIQLSKLPRGLALEGLEHAGTSCDHVRQVVKVVFEYAEAYPERMRQNLSRLEALARLGERP